MKSTGIKDVMTKTKTVAAATTLMAGLGVATNVHADGVTTPSQPETQVNQDKAAVTQADVTEAKTSLDTANEAVSHQEATVQAQAKEADSAQVTYDEASQATNEARALVDQATPEAISEATADVTAAQNQVSQAEDLQEQAESNQAMAETAVANQTQTVSQAQDQVTTSQAAVDAAQKDVNDKQAILDGTGQAEVIANRDNAQAAVNTAQDHVSQAESDLTKAQTADANRQQAIDNAQQAVDAANQTVTSTKADLDAKTAQAHQTQAIEDAKQADVATAQKDVNDKQAILDGTGQKAILDEAEAAKNDEASKQAHLSEAKTALQKAQEADANRQQAIDKAQKDVDAASKNVSTAKSDLDAKTAKAQQTAQALTDAQFAYKTAENGYKAINTITMSDEYAKALKDAYDYSLTKEQRDVALNTLASLAKSEDSKNKFIHNENDKKQSFDINHVTAEQAKELSLFAADLINQARKLVGTTPVAVTAESAIEAQKHANYYATTDMKMWTFNHDTSDLDAKYGWVDEDWAGNYFNTSSWANPTELGKETMDDAKYYVYDAIRRWIFAPDEWFHASSVVGTRNATTGENYIGVGLSRLKDGTLSLSLNIFNTDSSDLSQFDKTPLPNPNSSNNIIATYNTAKADLEAKTATNNSVQSALSAAQNNYNNAVAINTKAQQVLDEAQSVAVQTPTAKANLTLAEKALTKAQERLTKATQAVDALNADIKAKQAALTSAKAVLATAQSELAQAQANNKVAQEAKMTAQTAYDNAVSQLSSVSANLTQAQSVAVQTPTAQANLSSAKATLIQAQENLVKAQQAVDDLSADITVKQANLVAAKEVLASKQADLTAKQDALTQSKARLASLQADLLMAQENVVTAKANVDKAKAILGGAQVTLANLKNAPQLLKEAQAKEAIAKANLLDALDSLEAELLKLKDLQVKQVAAQAVYDTTSKAYQNVLEAQEKERLQAEYDSLVAQGKQPIPVVNETGKITGYTVLAPEAPQSASKAQGEVVTAAKKAEAKELPNTGTEANAGLATLGLLGALGGFGLLSRKKKED